MSKEKNETLSWTAHDTLSWTAHDTLSWTAHDTLSWTAHDTLSWTAHDTLSWTAHDTLGLETEVGVTKEQFVESLNNAAKKGMNFSLVALDSCESRLDDVNACLASTVIGSVDKVGYNSVNYSDLNGAAADDLSNRVAEMFRSTGKFN